MHYVVNLSKHSERWPNKVNIHFRHNSSRAFRTENFFLSRDLSRALGLPKREFWTGWYLEIGRDGNLPSAIHLSNSLNATSIYNPLWAPLQPHVLNSEPGQWCVSLDTNFASEDDYGWRLRDCKTRLPVICETFVCYNGKVGLLQPVFRFANLANHTFANAAAVLLQMGRIRNTVVRITALAFHGLRSATRSKIAATMTTNFRRTAIVPVAGVNLNT